VTHDLKALTRKWFDEVWTQGREQTIDEMVAPEIDCHGLSDSLMKHVDHFKTFYRMYRTAFPDITASVEECIQEGEMTACRVTFRALHKGDSLGFPATGKSVTFEAIIMIEWRHGKVARAHNQFDQLGILRQLGQETRSVTVA